MRNYNELCKAITKKFNIIEDNGGGLTLVIFDDSNEVSYLHTGYEYILGQLTYDLIQLANGLDPSTWDGCEDDPQEIYDNITSFEYGWEIIADNDGIYPQKMGAAGCLEFGIEIE